MPTQPKSAEPAARAATSAINQSSSTQWTVAELRQAFGLSRPNFARLTQFSERAIAKWEAGEALSPPSRQRMRELQRLYAGLCRVMKRDSIAQWLVEPNPGFHDLKPLEVVERGEIDRLWSMIFYLESGNPS